MLDDIVSFGIIGGGFRTKYFLRVARALPERFKVCGMVVRNEENGQEIERDWHLPTYRVLDDFLKAHTPDFVVLVVPPAVNIEYLRALHQAGIPALVETPPAADLDGLLALNRLTELGARIQVAEQYHLRPMMAARLQIIRSGDLGSMTEASVSISHGYHGISLLRKLLGVQFEHAKIKAMRFESPMVAGPSRLGPPAEEKIVMSSRDIAWIHFGDKLGIYDFTKDQHRSWIRSTHLAARGVRGEIHDHRANLLLDHCTPLHLDLKRVNRGEEENVEGYFLSGILLGDRWVYRNPYANARLYDDEIAVATCLDKMAQYTRGGPDFYSVQEASQDHYLAMLVEQAIERGVEVVSTDQPWVPNS